MPTTILVALVCVLSQIEAPAADALPEELSSLSQLWNNEQKLLEGVRQFDIIQQGMMDWDKDLAAQHQLAGDAELARQKLEQRRHRADLIRRAYEELLRRYPENTRAKVYLGELLYDRFEDEAQGVRLWNETLSLDPKNHEAMNNLAIHYSHFGQVEKALDFLDKALKLAPDNSDYLFNAAQIYLVQWPDAEKHYGWSTKQVYDKAMEYSRRAAELRSDDYPLLQDYAMNFFRGEQMGYPVKWADAAQAWQKSRQHVRSKSELFYTWLNEGRVWLRANQKDKATACLGEALKLFPDSDVAIKLMTQAKAGG